MDFIGKKDVELVNERQPICCDVEFAKDFEQVSTSSRIGGDGAHRSLPNYDQDVREEKFCEIDEGNKKAMSSKGISSNKASSSMGKATYAQSVKFSEYVQKVDFATRVPDELLPFAVYVEKLNISN